MTPPSGLVHCALFQVQSHRFYILKVPTRRPAYCRSSCGKVQAYFLRVPNGRRKEKLLQVPFFSPFFSSHLVWASLVLTFLILCCSGPLKLITREPWSLHDAVGEATTSDAFGRPSTLPGLLNNVKALSARWRQSGPLTLETPVYKCLKASSFPMQHRIWCEERRTFLKNELYATSI